jgi:hypothetical protein
MSMSIRAAVYLAEQECPYAEEFDGNDTVATHLIGFVGAEPAAAMRIRYFGGFAKMERLCVRREFRKSRVAPKLVICAVDHIRRKGFTSIYGHAMEGLETFWTAAVRRYGRAAPLNGGRPFIFSGHRFTALGLTMAPAENALVMESDPMVLNRPEGDWDREGVLETGAHASAAEPGGWVISPDGVVHPVAANCGLTAKLSAQGPRLAAQGNAYIGREGGYTIDLPATLNARSASAILEIAGRFSLSGPLPLVSTANMGTPAPMEFISFIRAVADACGEPLVTLRADSASLPERTGGPGGV